MLRYKAIARVATFVDTSEHPKQLRPVANADASAARKGLEIREWTCDECGAVHDRDVNAARNILRLGRQTLAEGSSIHVARLDARSPKPAFRRDDDGD
jgi:putative transposase